MLGRFYYDVSMASLHFYFSLFICLIACSYISKPHAFMHDDDFLKQVVSSQEDYGREHHEHRKHDDPYRGLPETKVTKPFVLDETFVAVRTEAGEIRTLPKGPSNVLDEINVGLALVTLEPTALLLPQYLNADCLFVVAVGKPTLAFVKGGDLQEVNLKQGDVYRIKDGTLFYLHNSQKDQKAKIFAIYDTSSLPHGEIETFFVAGGIYPTSVLSGFDDDVVATALRVSPKEVRDVLSHQDRGPMIFAPLNKTKLETKLQREHEKPWEFRSMLGKFLSVFADEDTTTKPYNVLDKSPDFENKNGKTFTVSGKDSKFLKKANIGLFAVKLSPGALLAPHWNPKAAEIGFVTKGEGIIQISYPNGTNALNKKVGRGTLFYVPRYYPMCQIASHKGPFEFVGLVTSSKESDPQFLAGTTSVLKSIDPEVLASAYRVFPDIMKHFIDSQNDTVILAGDEHAAPPDA